MYHDVENNHSTKASELLFWNLQSHHLIFISRWTLNIPFPIIFS